MLTDALGYGGAETHLLTLCHALIAQGHAVTVGAQTGAMQDAFLEAGVRLLPLPAARRTPRAFFRTVRLLARFLQKEEIDVLHAHTRFCALCATLARRRCARRGVAPLVTTVHADYRPTRVARALTRFGEVTLAVSEDLARGLAEGFGVARKRILLTRNGIDVDRFAPPPQRLPEPIRIVCLCRMETDAAAAAFALVRCAPRLWERLGALEVMVGGEGSLLPALEREVAAANETIRARCASMHKTVGNDRRSAEKAQYFADSEPPSADCVRLLGAVAAPQTLFAHASLAVVCSRAALEAMACGCAVILAGPFGFGGLFDARNRWAADDAVRTNFTLRGREKVTQNGLERAILDCFSRSASEREQICAANRALVLRHYRADGMAQDALCAYRLARAPELLLVGYYGFGNFGDEACRRALCEALVRQGYRVRVCAHAPRRYRSICGHPCARRLSRAALRHADAVVFGGGSLLQDRTSLRSLLRYLWWIARALARGKRVLLYANGLGPFRYRLSRRLLTLLLPRVRLVCRDVDSLALARSLGARDVGLCEDATYLLPRTPRLSDLCDFYHVAKQAGATELSFGAPFCLFSIRTARAHAPAVYDAIASCTAQRFFLPLQDRDVGACASLARRYGGVCLPIPTHEQLCALLAHPNLRAVYGERFHLLLYAKRFGVAAYPLRRDPKIDALGLCGDGDAPLFGGKNCPIQHG